MTDTLTTSQGFAPEVLGLARAAGDLVVRSDVMAVVAIAASAGAWLLAGWVLVRAAAPEVSHRRCLLVGADLLVAPSLTARARAGSVAAPAELAAAATGVALALLVPMSVIASVYLALAGHLPHGVPRGIVGLVALAALTGLCLSAKGVTRVPGRSRWLAVRGPHLAAAAVFGEVALAVTTTATAWALTHTEGTAPSLLEIGLASVVARGLTLTRIPRAGLVLADAVFFATLLGVGLSAGASAATVAVWRAGLGLARLVAFPGRRRRTRFVIPVSLPSEPTGSPLGECLHRTAFRVIGALPPRLARRTRSGVFKMLFSLSEDPWGYDVLSYERQKRRVLMDGIPPAAAGAGPIIELGCADGHNLQALADRYPHTSIVGLDISPIAVAAARRRTAHQAHVRIEQSDARGAAVALRGVGVESIGVLLVAEVLYYLGGPAQVHAELKALAPMMKPSGVLVLVHGASDAERLHRPAVAALGCATVDRIITDDPHRPFVVETARTSQASR